MINGKVQNGLWSHIANMGRQTPISNISKVEVLYGPSSALYGPNAFLGIINVITKKKYHERDHHTSFETNTLRGQWNTRMDEFSAQGKYGDFSFDLAGRTFRSDEADLSNKGVFTSNKDYSNRQIWGSLLDVEINGRKVGTYYDPSDDFGINGVFEFKKLKLGMVRSQVIEAYGPYFPSDRGLNNSYWFYD